MSQPMWRSTSLPIHCCWADGRSAASTPHRPEHRACSPAVSLYDGARGWFRIDADRARHIVDYHVGDAASQVPRVAARVIPGPVCGLPATSCYVTLTAWRVAGMDDDRWSRLCAAHEAEIWLIKAQIETAAAR